MHIPDGFLDAKTAAASAVLAAGGVAYALRTVRKELPARRVPLIGLTASFIFVAQMLNFPVAGGTSGHLIGATLAAVLLGPGAAIVVMTAVLLLQSLLFADGGLTALGANIFNMAIVAPIVGFAMYSAIRRLGARSEGASAWRWKLFGTAFGAWCSTLAAAIACAGQLAFSGTVAWNAALPAMGGIHMLIGIGEATITTLVVAGVARSRPELLEAADRSGPATRAAHARDALVYGLLLCAGLALFVAPFASGWPDGLEKVASRLGFEHRATTTIETPLSDYGVAGLNSSYLATAIAGLAGAALAFAIAFLLARVFAPRIEPAREANTPRAREDQ